MPPKERTDKKLDNKTVISSTTDPELLEDGVSGEKNGVFLSTSAKLPETHRD
jgi:hypothetical protein